MAEVRSSTGVTWDGQTAESLAVVCGVPRVELLTETDSTLDIAHALAAEGAASGTLVLADAQRAGRGRQGRSWSSAPGRGVWLTLVERSIERASLDVLSLRVGLFAAESLDVMAGDRVLIKWPNDLVVRAGKVAGILAETKWSGSSPGWVAVGVGVNVLPPVDMPGAAGMPAGVRRLDVLRAVVSAVRAAAGSPGHLTPGELHRYQRRDALAGRALIQPARGRAAGIVADGSLAIATDAGRQYFRAGTVELAKDKERS